MRSCNKSRPCHLRVPTSPGCWWSAATCSSSRVLLFAPGADTRITGQVSIGPFTGIKLVRGGQSFVFVDPFLIWPQDPIALILADPELNDYRIFQDPYSRSADDKTQVPADRVAVLRRIDLVRPRAADPLPG